MAINPVWPFTPQPNKWGYQNNPRWTNTPNTEGQHIPCGHWHKGPLEIMSITTTVVSTEPFWQQTISPIKSESILGIGALDNGSKKSHIVCGVNYLTNTNNLLYAHSFNVDNTDMNPGTTIAKLVGGIPTTFYLNNSYADITYYYSLHFSKVASNGSYSTATIFMDTDTAWLSETGYYEKSMCVLSDGTILVAVQINDTVLGRGIYVFRSTDHGSTWDSGIQLVLGTFRNINIDCDSNNNAYIVSPKTSSTKPFRLWVSTNSGASWSEISTVPTSPAVNCSSVSMAITGTKIYVYGVIYTGGVYINYIWYSSDVGVTWIRNTVAPVVATYTYALITANGDVVVGHYYVSTSGGVYYIIRSADNGANWAVIGQINPVLTWPTFYSINPSYMDIANDEEVFTISSCGSYQEGTDYLAYLISKDNGLTWEVKAIPVSRTNGVETTVTVTISTTYDEPQVWTLPKTL